MTITTTSNRLLSEMAFDKKLKPLDYSILSLFCFYFLIDFSPLMGSLIVMAPQYLILAILNIVTLGLLYSKKITIEQSFYTQLAKNSIFKLYITFVILACFSIPVAYNIPEAVLNYIKIIIHFTVFINFSLLLYTRLYLLHHIILMVGISLFIQAIIVLDTSLNQIRLTLVQALTLMSGNAGNINILAASFNVKIPFILVGIIISKGLRKTFFSITFFFATTVIFLISSRAAYIALFLEITIFIFLYFKIFKNNKNLWYSPMIIVFIFIGSFWISNTILTHSESNNRFNSILDRIEQIEINNVTEISAKHRLVFWKNALHLIKLHPIMGVGIGNWKIEAAPLEKDIFDETKNSSHTHNDFLEIPSEIGIIAGIIYLLIFVFVFFHNIKIIFFETKSSLFSKTISLIVILVLIGYGIDAFFNFPLYIPSMQLFFALFTALCIVNIFAIPTAKINYESKTTLYIQRFSMKCTYLYPILLIFGFVGCYTMYLQFKALQLEFDIRVDAQRTTYLLDAKSVENRINIIPNMNIQSVPYIQYVARYNMNVGAFDQALKNLDKAIKINPNQINSWSYKSLIFKNQGVLDSAYFYAKEAFFKVPKSQKFFERVLDIASIKKDTSEILTINKEHHQYIKNAIDWGITADALIKSGYNPEKTIGFLDAGLKEFPDDVVLLEKRKKITSKSTAEEIVNEKTIDESKDLAIKADAFFLKGNIRTALELYTKVSSMNQQNMIIKQKIAICYIKLKDFKKALLILNEVRTSGKINTGDTEYFMAICYLNINELKNACILLNIALQKNHPDTLNLKKKICN